MYLKLLLGFMFILEITAKIKCPGGCVCDDFKKLRRLKCSNKNLVTIIGGIPQRVQVFDVSYNHIPQIGDHELFDLGFTSMKIFNISHNKLAHIHLNGFRGINDIKTIDLSYNSLEYLLIAWFYDLSALEELYLNNNNFASLGDGPILESASLEILDLSNSRISHIKKGAFVKLPNLKKLSLDGNFLIQLNTVTLSSLNNLEMLSLQGNPLNCDKTTEALKEYLLKSNISYKDPCKKKVENEKFQRIMMEPDSVEKNTWILEEEVENVVYNCTKSTVVEERKGFLIRIVELSPILAILTPFLIGTLVGLILGCNVQIKSKQIRTKRRKRYSIIRRNQSDFNPLVLNCENIFESSPMPQRRWMEAHSL
nr:amphoterin-induced protein 1-like [Onthophagus taurus]